MIKIHEGVSIVLGMDRGLQQKLVDKTDRGSAFKDLVNKWGEMQQTTYKETIQSSSGEDDSERQDRRGRWEAWSVRVEVGRAAVQWVGCQAYWFERRAAGVKGTIPWAPRDKRSRQRDELEPVLQADQPGCCTLQGPPSE